MLTWFKKLQQDCLGLCVWICMGVQCNTNNVVIFV